MKTFFIGTGLIVATALAMVAIILMDIPKIWIIVAMPVLFAGFGLQLFGLWQVRPSVALPSLLAAPIKKPKQYTQSHGLGMVLALLGGIAAIGIAIWVTGNAAHLWALVLLALGISQLRSSDKPTLVGFIMAILYIGLGIVVYYVKNGVYLWAMILISLLTDEVL